MTAYGTINVDKVTNSDGITSGGLYGFKNRIINGAMMIDQRNAGASSALASTAYSLDRFMGFFSSSGTATVQRSTTAPAGFANSMVVTVGTADAAVGAGDYVEVEQRIEGFNVADLDWGATAAAAGKSASTVTLSFWVRSSLTGTYCVNFRNGGNNRAFISEYTISVANTWEKKTVTITGDTAGTWAIDNSAGLIVGFALMAGSTYQQAAGSWGSTSYGFCSSNQVNWMATSGNTFYITGVQLEKGSTATSFDYRPYGTELALCQRYYSKSYATETAPATATTVNAVVWLTETTSSYTNRFITFPVTMRSTPTFTAYSPATGASGKMRNVDTATDISVNVKNSCIYSGGISVAANNELNVHWTASAEL